MLFSVIMPLYNKARLVTRSLASIRAQTFRDFEVVVVDDGSSDGSGRIVEEYFRQHEFDSAVLVTQPNHGPGSARNRGIAAARGRYLAFLDADDAWLPEYLFSAKRCFERFPAAAAVTANYVELPLGRDRTRLWRQRGVAEGLFTISTTVAPPQLLYKLAYMTPDTTVVRADIARKLDGFAENARYAEDATLFLKILLNYDVFFSLKPLALIDRDASELSRTANRREIEPFLRSPEDVLRFCPRQHVRLLNGCLAMRSLTTASILGLWGSWRDAARLLKRYVRASDYRLPRFLFALLGATPIAPLFRPAVLAMVKTRHRLERLRTPDCAPVFLSER